METIKEIMEYALSKGISLDDLKRIRPEFTTEIRVEELRATEEVDLYLNCLETPQVIEYLSLTKPVKEKGIGHHGSKTPMDCPLACGKKTHRATWTEAKIDGVQTHVGTLSEICEKFKGLQIRVPFGTTGSITGVPLTQGQLAGRLKREADLGWKSEEELSSVESTTPNPNV